MTTTTTTTTELSTYPGVTKATPLPAAPWFERPDVDPNAVKAGFA